MPWSDFDDLLDENLKWFLSYMPRDDNDLQRWAAFTVQIIQMEDPTKHIDDFDTSRWPPVEHLVQAQKALTEIKDRLANPAVAAVAAREAKRLPADEKAVMQTEINSLKRQVTKLRADVKEADRANQSLMKKYVEAAGASDRPSVLAVTDLTQDEVERMTAAERENAMQHIVSTAMMIRNIHANAERKAAQDRGGPRDMVLDQSNVDFQFDRLMEASMGKEPAQFMKEARKLLEEREKSIKDMQRTMKTYTDEITTLQTENAKLNLQKTVRDAKDNRMNTEVLPAEAKEKLKAEFQNFPVARAIIDGLGDLSFQQATRVAKFFREQEVRLNKANDDRTKALEMVYDLKQEKAQLEFQKGILEMELKTKRNIDEKMNVVPEQVITDEEARQLADETKGDEFVRLLISSAIKADDLKDVVKTVKGLEDKLKTAYKTTEKLYEDRRKMEKKLAEEKINTMKAQLRLEEKNTPAGLVDDVKMTPAFDEDHVATISELRRQMTRRTEQWKQVVKYVGELKKAITKDQQTEINTIKKLRDNVAVPLINVVRTLAAVEGTNNPGFNRSLKAVGVTGLRRLPNRDAWDKALKDFELVAPSAYNRLAKVVNKVTEDSDVEDFKALEEVQTGRSDADQGDGGSDAGTGVADVDTFRVKQTIMEKYHGQDTTEGWISMATLLWTDLQKADHDLDDAKKRLSASEEFLDAENMDSVLEQKNQSFEEVAEVRLLRRPPFFGWEWGITSDEFFQVTFEPFHVAGYWLAPNPRVRDPHPWEGQLAYIQSVKRAAGLDRRPVDALLMMMRHVFDALLTHNSEIDIWYHQSNQNGRHIHDAKHTIGQAFNASWSRSRDRKLYDLFNGVKAFNCKLHWNDFGAAGFPFTSTPVLLLPFQGESKENPSDFKYTRFRDLELAIRNLVSDYKDVWGDRSLDVDSTPVIHVVLVCRTTQSQSYAAYEKKILEVADDWFSRKKAKKKFVLTKTVLLLPVNRHIDLKRKERGEKQVDQLLLFLMLRSLRNCLQSQNLADPILLALLSDITKNKTRRLAKHRADIYGMLPSFSAAVTKAYGRATLFRAMAMMFTAGSRF